jgi:hypothetical protein
LAFVMVAAEVRGEEAATGFALDWHAPAECPSGEQVQAEIARLLGGAPRVGARVSARAEVHEDGDHFSLNLTTWQAGEEWRRELRDPSCRGLADAAAVILAYALDPEAARRQSAEARRSAKPEPALPTEPPSQPGRGWIPAGDWSKPKERNAPAPHENEQVKRRLLLARVAGVVDTGVLPQATVGVTGAFGTELGPARFEAAGSYLFRQRANFEADPQKGGQIGLVSAAVRGCYDFVFGAWAPGICLGGEVGRLSGSGSGVREPDSGSALWLAAFGGAELEQRLSRVLSLRLAVDGVFALGRPTFSVEGLGTLHRPSVVSLRPTFGAEVHFP